jgi:HAE1 family hydrophobic/amphiphilic exporter-1
MYKLAINRPIATLMYVLTLALFGWMSFVNMPSALFPKVDFPMVTVLTVYPGAESATVESQITDKIEEAISQIGGVDAITSTSGNGISRVLIKFSMERNIDEAANDVRDKVSAVQLPRDARKPLVSKLDVGGGSVVNLFVTARNDSIKNLMLFVDQQIKPALQKLSGVGSVGVIGYRDREIRIFPDRHALAKYGITIRELNGIVARENVKIGGGRLITREKEFALKTRADATTVEQLRDIQVRPGVRLRDVARVEDGLSDPESYASYNGVEGVMLEVRKISDANTLQVIRRVKAALPSLQKRAQERFGIALLQDTSPFIVESLKAVEFDLVYGALLAVLIIFGFLRNGTITLVSALSLPTSVLGTIALMDFMGYDLNKSTLIALTLAIGIIIDDAIVVIENIYKKMEAGMGAFDAAVEGSREMAFPVIAISAMLLAVFLPVANMSGIVGQFFKAFGMTIAFAVAISYTVVMSFIPSLSARVLRKKESRFYDITEPIFALMDRMYSATLSWVLRHKFLTFVVAIGSMVASMALFPKIGMDFIPVEDKSEFEIKLRAQPGIALDAMVRKAKEVEAMVHEDPDVDATSVTVAYNNTRDKNRAKIYVHLVPKERRTRNQKEVIHDFREKLKTFSNEQMRITAAAIPTIKGAGVTVPYQVVLTSDSFEDLRTAQKRLIAYLSAKKGFVDIDSNLDDPKPSIDIVIDRARASRLGVSATQIAQTIAIAFSSEIEISHFEEKGKQFNITLRLPDANRKRLEDIRALEIRTQSGERVLLDGLVTLKQSGSIASINHYNRQRQVKVYADLYGLDLGGAVAYTKAKIDSLLPPGVGYKFTGFAEEMVKTAEAFGMAVKLSVILMFIILAILYESLIQPVVIMMALPMSIMGVMVALFLSGYHFSLFVMIGFILLMGMVGKNAVLLVDFANEAIEKEGMGVDAALIEAGRKRLRPILMTTIAMVFAMLPLAISHGFGAETKAPMSIAVIGGLLSSMFLTLLVVPVMYRMVYPIDRWLRDRYEGKVESEN